MEKPTTREKRKKIIIYSLIITINACGYFLSSFLLSKIYGFHRKKMRFVVTRVGGWRGGEME